MVTKGSKIQSEKWEIYFRKIIFKTERFLLYRWMRREGRVYVIVSRNWTLHVCGNPRIYLLQAEGTVLDEKEQESGGDIPIVPEVGEDIEEENLEILIHAISGSPSNSTLRLLGMIGTHSNGNFGGF